MSFPLAVMPLAFLLLVPSVHAQEESLAPFDTQVFDLPEGAGPHDVAPAPDGTVWYTGQRNGTLGILDPKDGSVHEIPLGEGAAPHGVIQGPDGQAWITDSGLNAIVRVCPDHEEVTIWPLPEDTGYANLNTAAFDRDGVIWFTGQSGVYGRLDPRVGEVEVFTAPKGRGPYGMTSTPDGEIWFVSLAGSYLAQVDRVSGDITMIEPPRAGQGARRVWSDSLGRIWVSEWNTGFLSRYDPKSGDWASWKLPGEEPHAYAVYVDDKDRVWVSDFGSNQVLSFDPVKQVFTPYPADEVDVNVRQIQGRPGEVWLPESRVDRLKVIRTETLL